MSKCQYILERDLPPVANAGEIEQIRQACELDKAPLGYSARKSVSAWRIHESQLRGAILQHIADKKRLFQKFKDDGSRHILAGHVQANITLADVGDVYVEIQPRDKGMIVIYAHDHTPGKHLLPQ